MKHLIPSILFICCLSMIQAQTPIWYDPASDNVYAISTAPDGNLFAYANGRIFKSTPDGDMLWEAESYFFYGDEPWVIRDRVIHTGPDGRLYVATNYGVYSCNDDGSGMSFMDWGVDPYTLLAVERDAHGFQVVTSGPGDQILHVGFDFTMATRFSHTYAYPYHIGLGTAMAEGSKLYFMINTFDPYESEQGMFIFDTTGVIDMMTPLVDPYYYHVLSDNGGGLYYFKNAGGTLYNISRLDADFSEIWDMDLPDHGYYVDSILNQVSMPDGDLLAVFTYYDAGTYCTRLIRYTPDGVLLYVTEPMLCSSLITFTASSMTVMDDNTLAISGSTKNAAGERTGTVVVCDSMGTVDVVLISGKVYEDANGNLVHDPAELEFPYPKIECSGLPFLVIGDDDGNYSYYLGGTAEETSQLIAYPYWDITDPAEYTYVPGPGIYGTTIEDQDFRQGYITPVTDLSITLIPPTMYLPVDLADPTTGDFTCVVNNLGNQVADNADVRLALQSYVLVTGTDPIADAIVDTVIYWTTDAIVPFASASFVASVEVYFDLVLLEDSVYATCSVTPTEPDVYPDDNLDTIHYPWLYCVDPNHKFPNPAGETVLGYVPMETEWITYTIQFQNTGDADAHHVKVIDTLSTHFDVTTLTMLDASDAFTLTMTGDRIFEWYFEDIMLSPSSTYWDNSIGSFTFRVQLKPGLPEYTEISNTAAIYFDLNEPIFTNTTYNTLKDMVQSVADADAAAMILHPNPTDHIFSVTGDLAAIRVWRITDLTGRDMALGTIAQNDHVVQFDIRDLPAGTYILTGTAENGTQHSWPVVKQ